MISAELLEHALSKTSVIIAVKDDPRILDCLESVDEVVEVVICLNGSPQWMRTLLDKQPMHIVVTEIPDTGNLGAAYNAGIAAASGQYLLLMDSDCTFAPGTIRAMAEQVMTNPIVKGLVKYGEADDIMSKTTARIREFDEGDFVSAQSPPLIYQRSIVKHIGGYHFDLLMHWCEDREFDFRVQLARIPVKFVEHAVIHHDAQIGFSNLRSYWRYGIGEGIGQEQGVLTTPAIPFLWRLADSIRSVSECLLKKGPAVAAYYALTLLVFHCATVFHLLRDPYDVRRRYSPLAKRTRMLSPIREHGTLLTNAQRKRLLRAHAEAGNPIDPVRDLSVFRNSSDYTMHTVDTFTDDTDLAAIRFRDFHQHPDRLSILRSQHVEATGLVVRENDEPSCFALLERANDQWYMWRGPEGSPNPAALRTLLAAFPQNETVTLILRPDWVHLPTLTDAGWRLTASWSTLHVRACDSGEALLARMRSSARGRVRRAQRAGLCFAMGAHLLDRYYPIYAQAMETSGSPDFASRELLAAHLAGPHAHLMVALDGDTVAAGTVCLVHANGIEARYVATNPDYRQVGPLHFVYLEAMRWAGEHGKDIFDLSGLATGSLDSKVSGINRFKRSFGGSAFTYPIFTREAKR